MPAMMRGIDLKGMTNSTVARLPISLVFSEVPSSSLIGTSSSLELMRLAWPK